MTKYKTQKGITLIALIITIIVMLILVGVTVTVALNGGLFRTAKQAKDDTTIERDKEQTLASGRVKIGGLWYDSLEDYQKGIESKNQGDTAGSEVTTANGPWIQNGATITNEAGTVTLEIGDKITSTHAYDFTDNSGNVEFCSSWFVLGVENSNLKLLSDESVAVGQFLRFPAGDIWLIGDNSEFAMSRETFKESDYNKLANNNLLGNSKVQEMLTSVDDKVILGFEVTGWEEYEEGPEGDKWTVEYENAGNAIYLEDGTRKEIETEAEEVSTHMYNFRSNEAFVARGVVTVNSLEKVEDSWEAVIE